MRVLFKENGAFQIVEVNHATFGSRLTLRANGYPDWEISLGNVKNQPYHMTQLLMTGFLDLTDYSAAWVPIAAPELEPPSDDGADRELDPYFEAERR